MIQYGTLDSDSSPIVLDDTVGGMISWLLVETDEEATQFDIPVGQYRPVSLQILPGSLPGMDDGLLTRFRITTTTVDDPLPEREMIAKATISARLKSIGKFMAVWVLFQENPDLFDKWYMPGWDKVYKDDEALLAGLTAIGLTDEQKAFVLG